MGRGLRMSAHLITAALVSAAGEAAAGEAAAGETAASAEACGDVSRCRLAGCGESGGVKVGPPCVHHQQRTKVTVEHMPSGPRGGHVQQALRQRDFATNGKRSVLGRAPPLRSAVPTGCAWRQTPRRSGRCCPSRCATRSDAPRACLRGCGGAHTQLFSILAGTRSAAVGCVIIWRGFWSISVTAAEAAVRAES